MAVIKPFDFLGENIGQPMSIICSTGETYEGILKSFDMYLNTVLSDVKVLTKAGGIKHLPETIIDGKTILLFVEKDKSQETR